MSDFLYSDVNYKLNTINKDLKIDTDNQAIQNSIRNILTIERGSLIGNPEFGSDISSALFEINDQLTFSFIEDIIENSLERWETRIRVINTSVSQDIDNGQIVAFIEYEILRKNIVDTFSLVLTEG